MSAITETAKPAKDPNVIVLKDVRFAYVHVAKPFKKKDDPADKVAKYSVTAIMDKVKHAPQIEALRARIDELVKTQLKLPSLHESYTCLKDGTFKAGKEGFDASVVFVSSSEVNKPKLYDQKKNVIDPDDTRLFSGTYGNLVIRLWVMDNKHGKKINAGLVGVQYLRSGEPLGTGGVDAADYLDEEEGEDTTDSLLD